MRLLLSGYYGFGNLGDEALLAVIVAQLRTRHPYAEIDVLSAKPEVTAHELRVDATPRWDSKAVRASIERADVVLSGGGGLLQNATSLRSLIYYTGIIRAAVRARRTTMIFAQSIGPLDFWGRTVVRETCKGIAGATVRDDRSRELLGTLLPEVRVERTADPAFLFEAPEDPDDFAADGLGPQSDPLAIISVRKTNGLKDRIDVLARAIDRLSEQHGLRVAFLPLGGASDAEVSTTIIRKCRTPAVLLPEASLERAANIIGRAKVLVGMRLHSLILAARQGVPFLAIPYDPKVTAFCADLAYPLPPLFSLETPEPKPAPEAIDSAIDDLWNTRDSLREYLLAARQPLERLALRNFEVLDELIARGPSHE